MKKYSSLKEALDYEVVLFDFNRITYSLKPRQALGTRNRDIVLDYGGINFATYPLHKSDKVNPSWRIGQDIVYVDLNPRNMQFRSFYSGQVNNWKVIPKDEIPIYINGLL